MTLAFLTEFFKWLNAPWMPEGAGGFEDNVDVLNGFVIAVCYFFTILIGALMVVFAVKFRQKDKSEIGEGITHSTPIEIAWTLPPVIIVLIIFAVGFTGYLDMSTPPRAGNAYQIRAEAYKWGWNFYYPNGATSQTLYIPSDRPTKLILESKDVLHSLYIPAFRAKKDVVPGRFNQMWFEPDPTIVSAENPEKSLRLHCTEYCGQGHSQMNTYAVVVHASQWEQKLADINIWNPGGLTPVELGAEIYVKAGCNQCHSVNGSAGTGPTWQNLYGKQNYAMAVGEDVDVVGIEYINESIRYPNRRKAAGWAAGNMSAYPETQLNAGDIYALVEFMKTHAPTTYPQGQDLEAFPEGYDGTEDLPADGEGGEEEPETAA
ncbi:MAG: cytochrome c oxidase subunit II [Planctomycetota bacterium]